MRQHFRRAERGLVFSTLNFFFSPLLVDFVLEDMVGVAWYLHSWHYNNSLSQQDPSFFVFLAHRFIEKKKLHLLILFNLKTCKRIRDRVPVLSGCDVSVVILTSVLLRLFSLLTLCILKSKSCFGKSEGSGWSWFVDSSPPRCVWGGSKCSSRRGACLRSLGIETFISLRYTRRISPSVGWSGDQRR